MRRFSKFLTVTASAALLSGCAAQHQLHRVAVDYNEMVAETSDELTLLNIVRAAHRYPMHFTTVSSLRGNASFSGSLGPNIGFKGDEITTAAGATTVEDFGREVGSSLGVSASSSPSFDVAVLNTENFQRGIMQPLPASLIETLIEQGWRDDLIAMLFIEKITFFGEDNKEIGVMQNDPGDPETICFQDFLFRHRLVPDTIKAEDTKLFDWADVRGNTSLSEIATLDGSKYDIVNSILVRKVSDSFVLKADHQGLGTVDAGERDRIGTETSGICNLSLSADATAKGSLSFPEEEGATDLKIAGSGEEREAGFKKATITFRSIQAAFYFLGEVVRPPEDEKDVKLAYRLRNGATLFQLAGNGSGAISTAFRGSRYSVAAPSYDDRSVQVIALLQQVLNLQKNAKDLPTTQTVNIVP